MHADKASLKDPRTRERLTSAFVGAVGASIGNGTDSVETMSSRVAHGFEKASETLPVRETAPKQ
eukprot:3830999-Pyramimonas_sp.AAC.1